MTSNGHLTAKQLVRVQGTIQLETRTAAAWRGLVAAAKRELGRTIAIAPPAGGYRSFGTQVDMHHRPWLYNMNPASGARLAPAGTSNHGLGLCVDVVGTAMDAAFLALARRHGFTKPLANDPNHFLYDGHTTATVKLPRKIVRKVLPASTKVVCTVQPGDTLIAIADRYQVSLAHLEQLNPTITHPNRIRIGQKVRVH